ncbi:LOW QUALITY PROTEIN: ganglioside GM2 activator [Dermochelys coriacea]|uniref:LOW QUALITY PROTEIN: ganglioside GM2 activator n=1 Tax=Dermochelys coriacea TaxID=27794 RepID=UPI001CA8436A|nr:LOW QUALITY PROTEIN: ganglioside GM2 activator [Dermochelys coriacea]
MQALALALCALQLCPAVRGGRGGQPFLAERPQSRRLSKIDGFSWENCGNGTDPFVIKSLSITPDPIHIPGDLKVSMAVSSEVDIVTSEGGVYREKKIVDMWIKVPCVDEIGSCTYDNLCGILDNIIPPGTPCPEPLLSYGIPCHCPFKQGSYSLPTSEFYLPVIQLPSWLTNGEYHVQVVLSNGAKQLACVKVALSLHSA